MARNDHSRSDRSRERDDQTWWDNHRPATAHDLHVLRQWMEEQFIVLSCKLSGLDRKLDVLSQKEKEMAANIKAQITELQGEMARDASVTSSAVTLIESVLTAVEENAGDEAALRDLVSGYRSNTDSLAAAVAKGTPADPNAGGGGAPA